MEHDLTPEQFNELGKQMKDALAVVKGVEGTARDVEEIGNTLKTFRADHETDVKRLAEQAAGIKATLAKNLGKSGSEDFLMDTSKFLCGIYHKKQGVEVPVDWEIGGNKVADLVAEKTSFTTTTAATAGYLLPELLQPGITELMDIYGNLYPAVTKVTVPPGQSLRMNRDAARPVAGWRGAQLAAIPEETTMEFDDDTLVTELLGCLTYIANELFTNPSVNFSAVATTRMLYAILTALEKGLLAGLASGDEPSNGVIADATDQGSAAAAISFAGLVTFLQDCIADNRYASDPSRNTIFVTPADALVLAAEQLGGTGTGMLVWGDSRLGIPTTFMGYRMLVHPDCDNGTNKYALLGDPASITLAENSAYAVDVSDHVKFVENGQALRVFNHFDWNLGQTVEWHKKIFT